MTLAFTDSTVLNSAPADVHSSARTKYRADVDGLRALAVISVLLFHGGVAGLPGGYIGVDVFFVISGFVIATKLLEEIDEGKFSLANFYTRRIRRILPALVATMVVSYVAAFFFLLPDAMYDFSRSMIATASFVSNLYFWKNSGYFETAALDRPLLHTWSLAIEEQFYIVIPIALFLLVSRARRWTFAIIALGTAASLALSVYAIDNAPTANFFLLPTRAWELLLGVMIALAPCALPRNRVLREVIAGIGLFLILFAASAYTSSTPFPGLAAFVPVLGAAGLIYLGKSGMPTFVSSCLSLRPVVVVGLLSYSLYLVHWPIIVFARYVLLRDLQGWEIIAALAAAVVLAGLSYRFVETPFRRPRRPASRTRLFASTGAALAGLCVLGLAGAWTSGFSYRHPDFEAAAQGSASEPDRWLTGRCFLENQTRSAWAGDLCVRTQGALINAILWGDSFAAQYIPGLIANEDKLTHNIVQYTFAGCPPILSYNSYARPACQGFNNGIFAVAARYNADTVVLTARWDQLRARGLDGLTDTVDRLRARGLKVYVIGQSPMFGFDVKVLDYRDAGKTATGESRWHLSVAPAQNEALRAASVHATFVDPLPAFCRDAFCLYKKPEGLLFADYGHFSALGSGLAVRSYFPLYSGDG